MAHRIMTIEEAQSAIAGIGAAMFAEKSQFLKTIDKVPASEFTATGGYEKGAKLSIAKPARFVSTSNEDITSDLQDIKEEKVEMLLDERRVQAVSMTTADITTDLALKSWAKRVLDPMISEMVAKVEYNFLVKAKDATFNSVGTPGSTAFDMDVFLAANQKITEHACPSLDDRYVLLSPQAQRAAVNQNKGLFNSGSKVSDQYIRGRMGENTFGFDFLSNSLLPLHTNGNDVVFEVRTTVATEGQVTLVVEALTANTGTVKKGTVFTIAGRNAVHPITKNDLQYAKQWVVAADATADASGFATLTLTEPFYTSASKGLQNVTSFPVDGDQITPVGGASSSLIQNLAYQKQAFRFASVPLVTPGGTDLAAQKTVDGITIRVIRDYQILSDKMIMRVDFLGGFAAVRPEWACRITA